MADKIEAYDSFFSNTVNDTDPELSKIINMELHEVSRS